MTQWRTLVLGLSCLLVLTMAAAGQKPPPSPAPTAEPTPTPTPQEKDLLDVMEPTQGRPIMVRPDENFYFMFWTDKPEVQKIEASLVHALSPADRVPLTAPVPPYRIQNAYWVMLLRVPSAAKPGVYDLHIDLGPYYQRVPRAVKIVAEFKSSFRFVHLSNMNVGEPTAPDFDRRLVDEINLLNPEFILATGDFIEPAAVPEPAERWRRIKAFFARFDAPCYILCGDLEDPGEFQKQVDPSPLGSFDYGPYHFLLTLDTQLHPIDQHQSNIEAVLENLRQAANAKMTFIAGRSEDLRILDALQTVGQEPADVFNRYHVRMLLVGGSTDWDFVEHAQKLATLKTASVDFVRTAQSSTSMKNGGSGRSHYRVIEVRGDHLDFVCRPDATAPNVQSSIAVGALVQTPMGPNDGSAATEQIALVNTLNQSFADCRVVFHLKGDDPEAVKTANCRLEQVLKGSGHLIALAAVDLPAKSAVRVLATSDPAEFANYEKLPVEFKLAGDKQLVFRRTQGPDGLVYFEHPQPLELTVSSRSDDEITVQLQVSLGGEVLMLGQAPASTKSADSAPAPANVQMLHLPDRGSVKLMVYPVVRSIVPGPQQLAVYCLNDPLQRVWVEKITATVQGAE